MIFPARRYYSVRTIPRSVLALTIVLGGCSESVEQGALERADVARCDSFDGGDTAEYPFSDRYLMAEQIALPSSGDDATLGLRGLDFTDRSESVGVDSRAGTVKFLRGLELVSTSGGPGEGPGEYSAPFDAVFFSGDSVAVIDPGLARVSILSTTGEFARSFLIDGQDPRAVERLGEHLAIGGLSGVGTDPRLLSIYDWQSGSNIGRFIPAPPILFETRLVADDIWTATSEDGRLFLGLRVSPEFYVVTPDLNICVQASEPPASWSQLEVPDDGIPESLPGMRDWMSSASFFVFAGLDPDDRLFRQYSTGQARHLQVVGRSRTEHLLDLPGRMIGVDGTDLILLADSLESVYLSRWELR